MTFQAVFGPPGSGKTKTLLDIVEAELASGTPPDKIAFLSFTRRAAEEAITRASVKFNLEKKDFPHFRTIHSLCFKWMGITPSEMLTGRRMDEFADYVGYNITGRVADDDGAMKGFEAGDRLLFMENLSRVRRIPLRDQYDLDHDQLPWTDVELFSKSLKNFKSAKGLYDYTDLLSEFIRLRGRLPIDVLIVDEAQDLSALQWSVVDLLAGPCRRVIVAGDDDQAIFRWAGADVEHLIRLGDGSRVLDQSWRVPRAVQAVCNEIISEVVNRKEKSWAARDDEGVVDRAAHISTVDLDGPRILILARNSYIIREQIEPELRARGMIYEYAGQGSVKVDVMDSIMHWERLRQGQRVLVMDIKRMFNFMTVGLGVKRGFKTLPNLAEEDLLSLQDLLGMGAILRTDIWHKALDRLPPEEMAYVLSARQRGEKLTEKPRIKVSTIHSIKGGEADHVVLMTEMAKRTFQEMYDRPEDESRVWYVGASRAKQRLTIVAPETAQYYPI